MCISSLSDINKSSKHGCSYYSYLYILLHKASLTHLSEHQIYFVKLFHGYSMNRDLWMTINAKCIPTMFIYYELILPRLHFLLRAHPCKSCSNELFIISLTRTKASLSTPCNCIAKVSFKFLMNVCMTSRAD